MQQGIAIDDILRLLGSEGDDLPKQRQRKMVAGFVGKAHELRDRCRAYRMATEVEKQIG